MSQHNQENIGYDENISTCEVLRTLAAMIDESRKSASFGVVVEPDFLRRVADELEDALDDRIQIMSSDGDEVLAVIDGELATHILNEGAKYVIEDALRRALEKPQVDIF
jgi:tRNA pseudouridine-54 N-methylase